MPPVSHFDVEPRRRRGWLWRIGTFLAFVAVLGGCAYGAWFAFSASREDSVADGTKVAIRVPKGASADEVAALLADAGVIRSERMFGLRLRLSGDQSRLVAGRHVVVAGSGYGSIVGELVKAPPAAPTYTVLVREGLRVSEIVALVDRDHRRTATEGGRTTPVFNGRTYRAALRHTQAPTGFTMPRSAAEPLEGFLFPATYELRDTATANDLIERQLAAFRHNWAQVDLAAARRAHLTPYDVLIIASMVEREAQVAGERPKVAAVIWNRLRIGMSLGIDATIQYAVDPVRWKRQLTRSDLAIDSPYNTRTVAGLPPTPIANPGLASMQAAAHPAKTKDLYYVAKGDGSGRHFFTDDYDAFLAHQ